MVVGMTGRQGVVRRQVMVPVVRGPDGTVYGARTRYVEAGEGYPAAFVHGGGVGGSGEAAWSSLLNATSDSLRGIAPDMLWSGFSDIPSSPYSLPTQADHLAGFVDALGIDKLAVVGQSMGAWIAARFACDHPGRVSHLILVGSNTVSKAMGIDIGESSPGRDAKRRNDGSRQGVRGLMETLVHNKELITDEVLDLMEEIAARPGMDRARQSIFDYTDRLDTDPTVAQAFYLTGRLDRMELPMCLIWGKDDVFAPLHLGHQLRELLPLDEYHEVSEAGHHCFSDQPEFVGKIITSFIGAEAA